MLKKPEFALIDLDGTLVDSVPDLAWAVDRTLEELGRPPAGEARVRDWVGNGVERLVKRALTGTLDGEPDPAQFESALPVFQRYYHEINGRLSRPFPGVIEGLEGLRDAGIQLGCVTNKAEAFTLPLLEKLELRPFFRLVVSGDTTPHKKPHPAPLLHAAEHFGLPPEAGLMVGDSRHDVEAARNAGFQVVAVTYGYNHGEDIRASHPDAVVDRLDQIPPLLQA